MWPTDAHPITREPFVACDEFHRNAECIQHRYLRKGPPARAIYRYEDDGAVWVRDRTDEEFAEALAAWEKADAQWLACMGTFTTRGPTITAGTFRTASGAMAQGYWAPKGWYWTSTWRGIGP